jgi:hypothetical protein
VDGIERLNGRPLLRMKGGLSNGYDLVVGAVGVNSTAVRMFESLGVGYRPPKTSTSRGWSLPP